MHGIHDVLESTRKDANRIHSNCYSLTEFYFVALIFLSNYRISKYINLIWTLFSVSNTELATWCNDECDEEDICE